MEMQTQDYLKKALLDTQERIRDFMNYSQQVQNSKLQGFFRDYAETEGKQAEKLQEFLKEIPQ